MNPLLLQELASDLAAHGFREVAVPSDVSEIRLVLKRQTWNTNRAIAVAFFDTAPADLGRTVRRLRTSVAMRCRFFPFFYGIGIQLVIVANGITLPRINPEAYVASIDNQWAIVQSVFLLDPTLGEYRSGRTWGQVITGKFQDAIEAVVSRHFRYVYGTA
jgi:hypothetical protein